MFSLGIYVTEMYLSKIILICTLEKQLQCTLQTCKRMSLPVLPWLNLEDGFMTCTTFGYNAPTKMAETSFQLVELIFA